ncbi:hypothetical protein J6590_029390 [Homalodisca vitripennis]|nr:hypothetical protein J6590_029390 [Homalodisca vitripennis]
MVIIHQQEPETGQEVWSERRGVDASPITKPIAPVTLISNNYKSEGVGQPINSLANLAALRPNIPSIQTVIQSSGLPTPAAAHRRPATGNNKLAHNTGQRRKTI